MTTDNALEIKHLSKTYPNQFIALDNISITIKKGDFFALLGPNGAGKSTTIGIISTLIQKTSGQVIVNGIDIDQHPNKFKWQIGVVPQEFNFNPLNLVEDILYTQAAYFGLSHRQAKPNVTQSLQKLGLWQKRRQPAVRLSGGMKRRLMIARALVHQPTLLLLDEPTAGVDVELRHEMWDFLTELNQQGVTIILTTHYLEEAERLCRHLAILNQGQVMQQGPLQQLLQKTAHRCFAITTDNAIPKTLTLAGAQIETQNQHQITFTLPEHIELNSVLQQFMMQNLRITDIKQPVSQLETLMLSLSKRKTNV